MGHCRTHQEVGARDGARHAAPALGGVLLRSNHAMGTAYPRDVTLQGARTGADSHRNPSSATVVGFGALRKQSREQEGRGRERSGLHPITRVIRD
jgi:hypothetical protein